MLIEKVLTATIEKNEKDENKTLVTFGHTEKEDYDGDLFDKGAYDTDENVWHGAWGHADGTPPSGFGPISENELGDIKLDLTYLDTPRGQEMKTIHNTPGAPMRYSYKFKVEKSSKRRASDGRMAIRYHKVKVYRVDPVDLPATPGTGVSMKSAEYREKLLKELEKEGDPEIIDNNETGSDILDQDVNNTVDIDNEEEELQLQFEFARANIWV